MSIRGGLLRRRIEVFMSRLVGSVRHIMYCRMSATGMTQCEVLMRRSDLEYCMWYAFELSVGKYIGKGGCKNGRGRTEDVHRVCCESE